MKLKDVIALGILSFLSFPLILLGILLGMDKIHLSFGDTPLTPEARARLVEHADRVVVHAPADSSKGKSGKKGLSEAQSREFDERESQILEEQGRLQSLQQDVARSRDSLQQELDRLTAEHKSLEQLLGRRDSVEAVRVKKLAATMATMHPEDAAKTLLGLDNKMAVDVLRAIPEERSRGKILAAIGHLNQQRASLLAKLLGSARADRSGSGAQRKVAAK